jgi:hypothetical protein
MSKQALTIGAYVARSFIAEAQRCVNLYPESNPEDAPFPTTHYPTPGLTVWATPPVMGEGRGVYLSSNGKLFVAVGSLLYYVNSAGVWSALATLNTSTGIVAMVDNGNVLLAVDGSTYGYVIDLVTNALTTISQASFYGATHVDYVDTFFVFNRPGTRQFYISNSNLNFQLASTGPIRNIAITTAGSGYNNATYANISLTGGTGSAATAAVIVTGGAVTSLMLKNAGDGYTANDVLSASFSSSSAIGTIALAGSGRGLLAGTYTNVPTTGGLGTGATLDVTVSGNVATSVTLNNSGMGYSTNDNLRTNAIPYDATSTGAFIQPSVTVTSVATPGAGFTATVSAITASTALNSLDIASKTGYPDILKGILTVHREIWLFGEFTTEVWYNTGAADFTFAIMPGVFIQYGCIAPQSIAKSDLTPFWLGQDKQGRAMILNGVGYSAKRISTHAIETEIQGYSTVTDAIGFCYQQGGHVFYVLNFPTGKATWVYDVSTGQWHQRSSLDPQGNLVRHWPQKYVNAYQNDIVIDYRNGVLYTYDLTSFQDNGATIPRIRSFPHIKEENRRIVYSTFIADMSCGESSGSVTSAPPMVSLRWSDDGGHSWGNAIEQSFGSSGKYNASVQWQRLGLGRDRVFELSWSANVKTALNGAYVRAEACNS